MHITPTSLKISQLLGSANEQYVIPPYQRRYSWHERQIWELLDDIKLLEDNDVHLLGSIVCLSGQHTAGLNKLELVDGQQRLTTISILLDCIRQRLEEKKQKDNLLEVDRLLKARSPDGKSTRKISLDSIDAKEFDNLVKDMPADDFQNQSLVTAFGIIREWIDEQTLQELSSFLYKLQHQVIIIRLDVSDAKDAFKLFETINNRGLKLSPTDIIKNFLLGNAARFGVEALETARRSWADLIKCLDGTNSDAFFKYFLTAQLKRRVTASYVVSDFKKLFMNQVLEAAGLPERHLYADPLEAIEVDDIYQEDKVGEEELEEGSDSIEQISFNDFVKYLVRNSKIYGELVLMKTGSRQINRHLRNLNMIKSVQTYGFLMYLRVGGCSDKDFCKVLDLTESFILRRHICRERANENETLFAKLCNINPQSPLADVKKEYRRLCPSDIKFRDEFTYASFTPNLIDRARYCLEKIEIHTHGKGAELQVLGSDAVHVEHIIPLKIKTKKAKDEFGDWVKYLGEGSEEKHPRYVSRIGNLTLFSGPLNIGVSNNPFRNKKKSYKESSIEITKQLALMSRFKFRDVEERSNEMADLAVKLWQAP